MNELTQAGTEWAQDNYATSIVARVALAGYGQGWPEGHVSLAVEACNARGAEARRRGEGS